MPADAALKALKEWSSRIARLGGRRSMEGLSEALEHATLDLIEEQHNRGIGANGVKLRPKLENDGKPPLTRSGAMRNSWFTRRHGLDFTLHNSKFYSAVHERGATIRAKRASHLRFRLNGRWVSKKEVRVPTRRMTPSGGNLPPRYAKRYKSEAEKHFNRIITGKLRGTF